MATRKIAEKARRQQMAPYNGALAPKLDEIRSMLAEGHSAPAIARHLESSGFNPGRGRNWAFMASSIAHIRRRENIQRLLRANG